VTVGIAGSWVVNCGYRTSRRLRLAERNGIARRAEARASSPAPLGDMPVAEHFSAQKGALFTPLGHPVVLGQDRQLVVGVEPPSSGRGSVLANTTALCKGSGRHRIAVACQMQIPGAAHRGQNGATVAFWPARNGRTLDQGVCVVDMSSTHS
jgi:hypothetical protein